MDFHPATCRPRYQLKTSALPLFHAFAQRRAPVAPLPAPESSRHPHLSSGEAICSGRVALAVLGSHFQAKCSALSIFLILIYSLVVWPLLRQVSPFPCSYHRWLILSLLFAL